MPQVFGPAIVEASLAELVAALFAAAVALSFRRAFPRRDLLYWGWAWLAATVFSALGVVGSTRVLPLAELTALRALARSAGLLEAALLLLGAHGLVAGGAAPAWLRGSLVGAPVLATVSALLSALPLAPPADLLLRAMSSLTIGVAAAVAAVWIWRRHPARPPMGERLMSGALSLYATLNVFSPPTLDYLGLLEGGLATGALFVGVSLAPVTFALGTVVSLLEDRARELTAERERLRVSEDMFAKLFRSSPDAVTLTRPFKGGLIVAVNEAFERLFGYTAAEAVGRTTVELGLFADPRDRVSMIESADASNRLRDHAVELVDRSGQRISVEISAEGVEIGGERHAIAVVRDVTKRKQAEHAVRRSEERLRLALDAARMAIWEWNPATGTAVWSERLLEILAIAPSDAPDAARAYIERVHPEDRPELERLVAQAVSGSSQVLTHEHRVRGDDGILRWMEHRARVFHEADRVVIRGTVLDVSERKQAEQALRASEEHLRRISEATFEGVSISAGGLIVDANEQFARMHGYSVEELIGRPVESLVAPADRPRVADAIRLHLTAPYEILGLRKDGSTFPADVRGRELGLGGRRLRVAAVRDMSERSELMERLALLGRATNDAVWDWDLRTGVLWRGEGIHTLFGYAQPEVRCDPGWWLERVHPDEADRMSRSLGAAIDGAGQAWSGEYRFLRGDGTYADVLDRAFVLRDEHGAAVRMVGAMLDVTEQKRVQDALNRSERMAAIGTLVAGVAHEVRTPLFGISATLDAYETRQNEAQKRREFIDVLRSQANRLSALMSDLLDYGRPAALRLTRGDVEVPLRNALRSCAGTAERRGVTLAEDLRPLPFDLEHDPGRLEQVFENVLSNAVHHSPRGGTVRVVVKPADGATSGVSFAIEDDGPGLPEQDLARVFEPFFSRREGGTGLGLAIVRRIVEEHGGSVAAVNRPGGGAAFKVFLPARRGPAA